MRVYPLTTRHFRVFSTSVRKYLSLFHLGGWQIELHHSQDDLDGMAAATRVLETRRADIYLAPSWTEPPTPTKLDDKAKHEVIHILLARLSLLAASRHCTASELYEAEEELVVMLMGIIPSSIPPKPPGQRRPVSQT
jgi:hypothetical protein